MGRELDLPPRSTHVFREDVCIISFKWTITKCICGPLLKLSGLDCLICAMLPPPSPRGPYVERKREGGGGGRNRAGFGRRLNRAGLVPVIASGLGYATTAKDAQGTPTKSHIAPSTLLARRFWISQRWPFHCMCSKLDGLWASRILKWPVLKDGVTLAETLAGNEN